MHSARTTQLQQTSPAEIDSIIANLRRAHARLEARPIDDILVSLEGLIASWLRPDSPWRRTAEDTLPDATGFSAGMIRFALPWMIEPLQGAAVANLLASELGDRDALDIFVGGRRATGPSIILHILAGNLPGAAALPITLSLAVKSCAFVKAAQGDRAFPALFAQSIGTVDPELGECVAAAYWPGGDRACEERALAGSDLVIASGANETITDLRPRCPVPFIGYGHKISFAVLTSDAITQSAAAALALDVTIWDQRGCLSPQVCFVEGDFDAAREFAALLAPELATLAARLPPGERTLADHAAIRRFRDEAEWKRIGGHAVESHVSQDSTDWTIVVENEAVLRPTPLGRSIRILPIRTIAGLPEVLAPMRPVLESAGRVADSARAAELDDLLARSGVHWLAPLGRMQRPPLSWPQGGRSRVGGWVGWTGRD